MVPDDSFAEDLSPGQKDPDSQHSMMLPLQTDGDFGNSNQWQQIKTLSAKRDYNDDRLNEARQQQRPFTASCDVCKTDVSECQFQRKKSS
jgi:hypothetical protein